jgi:hypothetical protein
MASLAKTAVSPYPTGDIGSSEWPSTGKGDRGKYIRMCKVVLSGQGTAANSIPAAAFGFSRLLSCGPLVDITNAKLLPAAVDPTRNIILIGGGAANILQDVTSAESYITVEGIVSGYSP